MAPGNRQPKWDIYEAAILLDGYLETIQQKHPQKKVVKRISADLRRMAINRGTVIDDVYRNENGISYQIRSMKSAFWGYKINIPATKLFTEIVSIYHKDREHFERILSKAKNMIMGKEKNRELFLIWAASHVTSQRYKWIDSNLLKVEKFGKTSMIITDSIYDITNIVVLDALYFAVTKNKIFRIKYRKYYRSIIDDFSIYIHYCSQMKDERESLKNSSAASVLVNYKESQNYISQANNYLEKMQQNFNNELLKITESIISSYFVNGMRKNSIISKNKFKSVYRELMGEELSNDIDINVLASNIGFEYNNKFYVVSETNKEKLKEIINMSITSGNRVMFYEEVYKQNLDFMTSAGIFSTDLLKIILKKILPCMRYRRSSFSPEDSDSLEQDIIACYDKELMLTYREIKKRLPYADLYQIRSVCSRNCKFVWAKEETYALTDKISLSSADIENSIRALTQDINSRGFSVIHRIIITESIELNLYIPETAIKEALFIKHLSSYYEKNRSIITLPGASFSATTVMAEYCKSLSEITLSQLQLYEEELTDKSIYALSAAYDTMIRVDKERFVSIDSIFFDVHAIDNALSHYVQDSVIPLSSVKSFTSFPEVEGYVWNLFLLDSYCRHISEKFRSLGGPAKSKPVGAVFPIYMKFDSYDDLLAEVVAKSNLMLNAYEVNEYFAENSYTLRKIDTRGIIAKAQETRIQEDNTNV